MSQPILVPPQLESARLVLRPPAAADAEAVNRATHASFTELERWMDWAKQPPTLAESLAFCETGTRELVSGTGLPLLMWRRSDGALLGGVGCAAVDLTVPKFELGYWCLTSATGQGYVTEAVALQCRYFFTEQSAQRIELRMDDRNAASYRVAERLGFTLEGTLRNDARANDGSVRDTRIYALFDIDQLQGSP